MISLAPSSERMPPAALTWLTNLVSFTPKHIATECLEYPSSSLLIHQLCEKMVCTDEKEQETARAEVRYLTMIELTAMINCEKTVVVIVAIGRGRRTRCI